MRRWILNSSQKTVVILSMLFFAFLTGVSLISTAYFSTETSFAERPAYRTDNILLNLLFLAAIILIGLFIDQKYGIDKIPTKPLSAAAASFVVILSIVWIQISHTYPEADQKAVSYVASLLAQDNFLFFEPGKYMQIYPNQLGLAAILEGLYRLTGGETWKAFMYLTTISNGVVVWILGKLSGVLFRNRKITNLVLLLSMGCVQITLYSTFLYGMMLGLALALLSFYFLLKYLDQGKMIYGIGAGLLIGAAVLVKNNYSIFLVAMVIFLLLKYLDQKKIRHLAVLAILLVSVSVTSMALKGFYEKRSDMAISDGMPKSLWIAMGMQEGERAEGWYNAYNYDTFLKTGCNAGESDRIAKKSIRESLSRFGKDPAYALKFYYKKTVSQWNEPTYEALWVNQFHSGDFSRLVQSIYDGKLYTMLHEYMNVYQSLIFAAAFIAVLAGRRQLNLEQLFLVIVILGGFFFHLIWEAKSQYIFPYFVIFIPYAAAGIAELLEWKQRRKP